MSNWVKVRIICRPWQDVHTNVDWGFFSGSRYMNAGIVVYQLKPGTNSLCNGSTWGLMYSSTYHWSIVVPSSSIASSVLLDREFPHYTITIGPQICHFCEYKHPILIARFCRLHTLTRWSSLKNVTLFHLWTILCFNYLYPSLDAALRMIMDLHDVHLSMETALRVFWKWFWIAPFA